MEQKENTNPVEQMIHLLSTPIAKRNGVKISAEDCKVWVEELKNYLDMLAWAEAIDEYLKNDENY